jgi:hypothetical protein
VGPRAGLAAVEKRKISCPCRESKPSCPDRNPSLYQPSYRGSYKYCVVSPFLCRLIWADKWTESYTTVVSLALYSWSPRFSHSAILMRYFAVVLQSDGRIPHNSPRPLPLMSFNVILSSDATKWDATNRSLGQETSQILCIECSLPYSQEPITGLYGETDKSSPHLLILFV